MLRVDSGRRPAHAEEPSGQPARGWTRSAARAFLAPKVAVYVLPTFLVMLGWYGLYTFLGTALRNHFGARSSLTGVMILLCGLGFATSIITGRWADRLGKERVLTAALAGLVPALADVSLVTEWTLLLVICLFLWGVLQSLLSTLLSECSERHRGTVLAFYSLATNLAVALGAALLAPLFTSYGFTAVGWACAAITLIAFGLNA